LISRDFDSFLKVYDIYEKRFPEILEGHILKLKFYLNNQQYELAKILIEELEVKFGKDKRIYKERIKLAKILDKQNKSQAIRSNYFSSRFSRYLEIIDQSSESPLKYQSILIITYGRSGSTLLQGILNSIPNVKIWGETYNVFHHLFRFYESTLQLKWSHEWAVLPTHPYFRDEEIAPEGIIEEFKAFVPRYFNRANPSQIIGFKEIRYVEIQNHLDRYLNFLAKIFPNPLFVFNTRNLTDVVKSGWWKNKKSKEVRKNLEELEKVWANFSANRLDCFQISYEDIMGKSKILEDLFLKIGATYDPEIIDFLLQVPHSYDHRKEHKKESFQDFPIN
jgi:hypothetical protein